jgi:hypothetical protein
MAQYRDLADYITRRAKMLGLNAASLSQELGYGSSYINSVINRQFQPSQKRCREIAAFFEDDPNIILALAGYYEPLRNNEPYLRDIEQAARSLPPPLREDLLNYAVFLKERSITYDASGGMAIAEDEPGEPPEPES